MLQILNEQMSPKLISKGEAGSGATEPNFLELVSFTFTGRVLILLTNMKPCMVCRPPPSRQFRSSKGKALVWSADMLWMYSGAS